MSGQSELLVWHGATADDLDGALARTAAVVADAGEQPLAGIALTLAEAAAASSAGDARVAIVAADGDDLTAKIAIARESVSAGERLHGNGGVHVALAPMTTAGPAFLFSGQGSQVIGMGAALAAAFPEAQAAIDRADAVLAGCFDRPLSELMVPPAASEEEAAVQQAALTETNVAQPALGAVELAYLAVLGRLGVGPAMTAGHSYGEFAALHAAGVISDADLLLLSEARGRFMREGAAGGDPGSMAAVSAGPEAISELVDDDDELVMANFNGPRQTVIAGSGAAIERALAWCKENGVRAQQLQVACAFHSPYVAPAKDRLAEVLRATDVSAPRLPVYSNTTAAPHSQEPAEIVATLAEHLVGPVRFTEQITAMHDAGARVFVEIGPKTVLTSLTKRILGKDREHVAAGVDQGDGIDGLLGAVALLWTEGTAVAVERLFDERDLRPVVSLDG